MFCKTIDAISETSGKATAWLVILLSSILIYDIFARYLFNAPTMWAFDLSYMIGGSFFVLGEAHTLRHQKHVRIDLFYGKFSPRTQALLDCFFYLLFFFPLWIGIMWALVPYVAFSWEMGEKSMQGYWQPILYPFKTIMPIGVGLLLMQGVSEFLKSLETAVRGKN